jgi:hypothetical protein
MAETPTHSCGNSIRVVGSVANLELQALPVGLLPSRSIVAVAPPMPPSLLVSCSFMDTYSSYLAYRSCCDAYCRLLSACCHGYVTDFCRSRRHCPGTIARSFPLPTSILSFYLFHRFISATLSVDCYCRFGLFHRLSPVVFVGIFRIDYRCRSFSCGYRCQCSCFRLLLPADYHCRDPFINCLFVCFSGCLRSCGGLPLL